MWKRLISLGSKRVSGVEEKAAERGNGLSIFVLLALVNTASFWAGCFSVSGCWLPWFEYAMDPKDPVPQLWFSSCSHTLSRQGLKEGYLVIGGVC